MREEKSVIVVKVEKWPNGDPTRAEQIGEMRIWHEGKPLDVQGHQYAFAARTGGMEVDGVGVHHYREQWIWELVRKVLSHAAFARRRTIRIDDGTSAVRATRMPEADEDGLRI